VLPVEILLEVPDAARGVLPFIIVMNPSVLGAALGAVPRLVVPVTFADPVDGVMTTLRVKPCP
jgi:hypothetical protein